MKIVTWNTNGLRATVKGGFFEPIFKGLKPDILCLQETKAEIEQLDDATKNIPSYVSYFVSSKLRRGYSGVATYTKRTPDNVEYGLGIKEFDDEGRTLVLYFGKVILINCYFPNGGGAPVRLDYKLRFYDAFLLFIDKKKKEGYSIIFTGDVNVAHEEIDLARPKENETRVGFLPEERAWIDEVIAHGYTDVFRYLFPNTKDAYTYWDMKSRARDRNVGWRIDYFFVSPDLLSKVKRITIENDYLGSDHCPVVLDIDF
jgi:exodeoxyribonuclease-3